MDKFNINPLKLIHKLEEYSKDQLRKLSLENKEILLKEIEVYLKKGITPLEKYYNELKAHFSLPSKNLMNFDRNHFYKQLKAVRISNQQNINNIIKISELAAKKLVK